jgi:hypothetical protein
MLERPARLQVAKDVAAKVVDGEAIILNLANGMYYSTDGVGADIWRVLARTPTTEEIVEAIAARYAVPHSDARADIERLVDELLQENLLIRVPAGGPRALADEVLPAAAAYQMPVLNSYRDMGDLLALDPPMPDLEDLAWKESDDGRKD